VGHQWFWSYELSDFVTDNGTAIDFDSYMTPADWFSKSKSWAQISNSGNTLKIQVPIPFENKTGGQNFSLDKVTSFDIIENKMGYRGYKTYAFVQVKEQRVDDIYNSQLELLRYTLMASAMRFQTEELSNQNIVYDKIINSNKPKLKKLDSWFLTGFVDAEGCFSIEISKDSKAKFKYTPRLNFIINLHVKDLPILLSLKDTWGVGTLKTKGKVTSYRVKTFKDLEIIVKHFELYPLVSSKSLMYQYWLQAYNIMERKEHFNYQGMIKLATLKSLMNYGLSDDLKKVFPELKTSLIDYKFYSFKGIPHGMWVAGFTSGDGSFYTKMTPYKNTFYTGCIFKITLHPKDNALLEGLFYYFSSYFPNITFNNYGARINKGIGYSKETVSLTISNIQDISNIIIPFFDLYPILGVKLLDYNDFKLIYKIIISKDHLTPEGLDQIIRIRNNMNNKRK
jgi:LAGLIDADG endonuclease/Cytochrome C oxidase subunit II, periplasmic domain